MESVKKANLAIGQRTSANHICKHVVSMLHLHLPTKHPLYKASQNNSRVTLHVKSTSLLSLITIIFYFETFLVLIIHKVHVSNL